MRFLYQRIDHWRHFRTSGESGVLLRSPDQETDALLLMSWESRPSSKLNVYESTRYQLVVTLLARNRLILKINFLLKVNSDSVRVGVLFFDGVLKLRRSCCCCLLAWRWPSSKELFSSFLLTMKFGVEGVGPMCLGQKECVWNFNITTPLLYKLLHTRVTRFTKTCFVCDVYVRV